MLVYMRQKANVAERINGGAITSAEGVVEYLQLNDEITSVSTPDCTGINCVRSSITKTQDNDN